MKLKTTCRLLSLIALFTGILNGYYLFFVRPCTVVSAISMVGLFTSFLLFFSPRSVVYFMNSSQKNKYRKLFLTSWIFGIWFTLASLIGLVYLLVLSYTFLPLCTYPILNIIFNILPLFIIMYLCYIIIRLCLIVGKHMDEDGSVKQTLQKLWRERKREKKV